MFGRNYKRESGTILNDGQVVASTQQCVHCGNHEIIHPGSGVKRGWCMLCGGFVCGKEECMKYCIPFEARIEYQEALSAKRMDMVSKLVGRYPQLPQIHI